MKHHQILGYNEAKDQFIFLSCLLSYKEIEARILNGEVPIEEDFDWKWETYSLSKLDEFNIKLTGNSVPLNRSLCFTFSLVDLRHNNWFIADRLLEIEEK